LVEKISNSNTHVISKFILSPVLKLPRKTCCVSHWLFSENQNAVRQSTC